MIKNKKESFFWTSYSDLMTSLFFVMLVLFVLTVALLHNRVQTTQNKLNRIQALEESTKDLKTYSEYFKYVPKYEKYILTINVNFAKNESDIWKLPSVTRDSLCQAGVIIANFMRKHNSHKYLLIIEGQASNDNYEYNYELSYERAVNLLRFWNRMDKTYNKNINFGNNCEVQISGSGDGKLSGTNTMREIIESRNQRFLIHIISKHEEFND